MGISVATYSNVSEDNGHHCVRYSNTEDNGLTDITMAGHSNTG